MRAVALTPQNTAIARTEREIALVQEYRTRLTADIVTGKLDVREAAAKLPDLPTEHRRRVRHRRSVWKTLKPRMLDPCPPTPPKKDSKA